MDTFDELLGGLTFNGPAQLTQLFLARADDFTHCLTEKLLTYALGRKLGFIEQGVIRTFVTANAKDGRKLDRLVVAITQSYPFQYRRLNR